MSVPQGMLPLLPLVLTLLTPPLDVRPSHTLSRRAALLLAPAAALTGVSGAWADDDECDNACQEKRRKEYKEKLKARTAAANKKRIEDSKKGPVRKPTDLVENRRKTVDYSCVVATGSPCPTDEAN